MNTFDKIIESNKIEGILRLPTPAEVEAHDKFVRLKEVNVEDLEEFVKVYQPDARLRTYAGWDVIVGSYEPPPGGARIRRYLIELLQDIGSEKLNAWEAHVVYEQIHPFTDCNGRSGRALWYWMVRGTRYDELGFLHAFYYQTLNSANRKFEHMELT